MIDSRTPSWAEVEQTLLELDGLPRLQVEERLASLKSRDRSLHDEVQRCLEELETVDRSGFLEWPVGHQIGGYQVLEPLGEGGESSVYLARQEQPRRLVALKLLHPRHGTSEVAGEFLRQADLLAKFWHPHIAAVIEASTLSMSDGKLPYIIMEHVRGTPVDRHVVERSPGWKEVLSIFEQVSLAVDHAHEKDVIHRDLKPGNILIDEEGKPKLIDLGISRKSGEVAGRSGTWIYMSPEQREHPGRLLDRRSDIYSLGVVMREVVGLATRARSDEPPRGDPSEPELPVSTPGEWMGRERALDLKAVLDRATHADREQRYRTAQDLTRDLRRIQEGHPVSCRPLTSVQRFRRAVVRHPLASVVCLVLTLLLVGSLFLLALSHQRMKERLEGQERLTDTFKLDRLLGEVHSIFTPVEENREAMEGWIRQAREIADRFDLHRDHLARLEAERKELSGRNLESGLPDSLEYEVLSTLVPKIERLRSNYLAKGTLQMMETQYRVAREVHQATVEEHREAWEQARAAILEIPEYQGLDLSPQIGLIPLGPDPGSGLWEFYHWQTGKRPERDPDGVIRVDGGSGIVFVLLPGGEFDMGSPESEPGREEQEHLHRVTLTPFFLSKYETTQGQYRRVRGYNYSHFARGDLPVDSVPWNGAFDFCRRTALILPTEARWEYACRAGTQTPYAGPDPLELGWTLENSEGKTHAPGGKKPNAFGLYDLHGNVQEWCQDAHRTGFYRDPGAVQVNPVLEVPGTWRRIHRGGAWNRPLVEARSARRGEGAYVDGRWNDTGFRAARDIVD